MRYKRLFLQEIAGQITTDGKKVRGGLLYRSGDFHRLRPRDLKMVHELGIKQTFDLRESEVTVERPNRYTAPMVTNMPVRLGEFGLISVRSALRREVDWSNYDFENLYVLILEQNKDYLCRFLDYLVDGPHPALIHCTAGKDRTGVFVASLLLALQVPRETVMQWYLSPGEHLEKNTPAWVKLLARYTGLPREALFLNHTSMEALFNHLDQRYCGIDGYLSEIGFTRVDDLRSLFLSK